MHWLVRCAKISDMSSSIVRATDNAVLNLPLCASFSTIDEGGKESPVRVVR